MLGIEQKRRRTAQCPPFQGGQPRPASGLVRRVVINEIPSLERRGLLCPIRLVCLLMLVVTVMGRAQTPPSTDIKDPIYFCPMPSDRDIRSSTPGTCERCGMKLVAGIPDPVDYHLNLGVTPAVPKPGAPARLTFTVHDPWKDNPVKKFQIVHEKLFHAFIVSQNLEFFVHDHPTLGKDQAFHYDMRFPTPGMYRILGDFFPDGGTPQLIAKTVFVPGQAPPPVPLRADYTTKTGANMEVDLVTTPALPIAGQKTQLIFRIKPGEGLEKYLGAWGHMLAASDDLIDMIHQHPLFSDEVAQTQFSMIFPRARTYRIWVQFQREGVVNTVHFDVPVTQL